MRRWNLWGKIQKANALIEAECKKDERLTYVDITKRMLGDDGKPQKELLLVDGLHLNGKGYEQWTLALKPYLKDGGSEAASAQASDRPQGDNTAGGERGGH